MIEDADDDYAEYDSDDKYGTQDPDDGSQP